MAEADDFKEALAAAAARGDALRAAGLKDLDRAVGARQAILQRETARLARRLGADHPQVKATAARAEGAAALRRDLAVEVVRAETPWAAVGPQEWALHGYVRWKDRSPAPEVTVSLVDASGQWLRALGFACTDARGYFRLLAKVEHPPDTAVAILSGYLRVTDAERKELHRDTQPLPVLPGASEYREIALEGEGRACAAPEDVPQPGPAPRAGRAPRPPRKREPS